MNDHNKRPQALLEQCLLCPVLWWGHAEDGVCDPGLGWAGLGWAGLGCCAMDSFGAKLSCA